MLCELMLQAEDLGTERTGVVPTLVVGSGQVLLEPVAMIENLESN